MPSVNNRFNPKLSDIMTADDLPEFLSFAADGIDQILDNIHYKNLQFSKNARGDSASYSLEIISKNVGLKLPFGFRLVLNPDTDTNVSSFPPIVRIYYPDQNSQRICNPRNKQDI